MTDSTKIDLIGRLISNYHEYLLGELNNNNEFKIGYIESILDSIDIIINYSEKVSMGGLNTDE